jgi:hypothetical protein
MKSKVKVKRGGIIIELDFSHVERIFQENPTGYEIVDTDKYQFDGKDLVKQPKKKKKTENPEGDK